MAKVIFDDWKSFIHFAIGFFSAFLGHLSIVVIVVYVLYQRQEKEMKQVTNGDLIEYIMGFIYGLTWR